MRFQSENIVGFQIFPALCGWGLRELWLVMFQHHQFEFFISILSKDSFSLEYNHEKNWFLDRFDAELILIEQFEI